MQAARPGECIDKGALIPEIDFSPFRMQVSTERYHSPAYHEREQELLWMRVWQIAGRADDLPKAGDWVEHRISDQSYVLVRGKDGEIRGFVNACRHRGNAFCEGKGHSARFTCPYHNWSYGLDGKLLAVAKPDFDGTTKEFVGSEKEELGLVQVPVECFAGFIFLNPDRDAAPLSEFLGEAADLLAPYHLEEMVPVGLNVRETIECNWKVVSDAFQEGYHVQGVHPELADAVDLSKERCSFFGDHAVTTVPFTASNTDLPGAEGEVQAFMELPPANFPGIVEVLPHFEELVATYRKPDTALEFPEGITTQMLFQQATRSTMTAKGLDVSGLTENQMSDFQFWLLFPNIFIQIRAGEATIISTAPHPDGNPNRCYWHVMSLLWLPPEKCEAAREPLLEITEGEHFTYFLALEQDYEQMEIQQRGLRNRTLTHMILTRQEPKLAHFHSILDSWLASSGQQ